LQLHIRLFTAQKAAGEVRRYVNDHGGMTPIRLLDPLPQLFGKNFAQKIPVLIVDQHARLAIAGIARGAVCGAEDVHEDQGHHEQPGVARLLLEKKPHIVVAEIEDLIHSRRPASNLCWNIATAEKINTALSTSSFIVVIIQSAPAWPDCRFRAVSANQ